MSFFIQVFIGICIMILAYSLYKTWKITQEVSTQDQTKDTLIPLKATKPYRNPIFLFYLVFFVVCFALIFIYSMFYR